MVAKEKPVQPPVTSDPPPAPKLGGSTPPGSFTKSQKGLLSRQATDLGGHVMPNEASVNNTTIKLQFPMLLMDIAVTSEGATFGRDNDAAVGDEQNRFISAPFQHDTSVSRRHFRLDVNPENRDEFCVQDLGSSNGTWIQVEFGKPLGLVLGGVLRVGYTQLEVVEAPAPVADPNDLLLAANSSPEAPPPAPSSSAAPALRFKIVGPMTSSMHGREFSVGASATDEAPFSIGRGNSRHLALTDDGQASALHCRVVFRDGQFYLLEGSAQRASSNGTFWRLSNPNKQSVRYVLREGMAVVVGEATRFVVSYAGEV